MPFLPVVELAIFVHGFLPTTDAGIAVPVNHILIQIAVEALHWPIFFRTALGNEVESNLILEAKLF